jgi:YwiC-like protein
MGPRFDPFLRGPAFFLHGLLEIETFMATHRFQMSVVVDNRRKQRMGQLVWPREHGAWGMLFVPLATGGALGLMAGGAGMPLLILVVAAFALFCLRTPVESMWGASPIKAHSDNEWQLVTSYLVVFAVFAIAALAGLFSLGYSRGLALIGAVSASMFVAQTVIRSLWKPGRMWAQMLGAIGLTSTAAAAYFVTTGQLDRRALALWAANWIFAGNQIHFVQVRLHASKLGTFSEKFKLGGKFFDGQFAMWLALGLAWYFHWLPALALIAFVPVFLRGLAWFFRGQQPLSLKRLGFTELAHAIAFGALLTVAFRVS